MKRRAMQVILCLLLSLALALPTYAEERQVIFKRSSAESKKIALTFDDGPHPRYTDKILKILEKYGIKATFFVIGVNIENYPEVLERVSAAGHQIGNHSYSHTDESELSCNALAEEIRRCEELIAAKTGKSPTLFRPPRGKVNSALESIALDGDYSVILWSIDTRDWAHNPPDKIAQVVMGQVRGGDIILMHDYISGENTTCAALERIIPQLLSRGYEFVTVSELIVNR